MEQGTCVSMVGEKAILSMFGKELVVKILHLDFCYPRHAYAVSWTKEDNPGEDIPPDQISSCGGMYTIAHHSCVRPEANASSDFISASKDTIFIDFRTADTIPTRKLNIQFEDQ